jgi:hypothetical protein
MSGTPAQATARRRAALCLGASLVCLVFLLETWVAHQRLPSPASPYVWSTLGLASVAGLAGWAWFRRRSRRAPS